MAMSYDQYIARFKDNSNKKVDFLSLVDKKRGRVKQSITTVKNRVISILCYNFELLFDYVVLWKI